MIEREIDLGKTISSEDVKERLSLVYERMLTRGINEEEEADDDADDGDEKAFYSGGSKFKGRCNFCGEFGHKIADCPKKKKDGSSSGSSSNNNKRFNGKCNYCGIFGHKESDCRKKKAAMEKEKANIAKEDDEEIAFIALEELSFCTEISRDSSFEFIGADCAHFARDND